MARKTRKRRKDRNGKWDGLIGYVVPCVFFASLWLIVFCIGKGLGLLFSYFPILSKIFLIALNLFFPLLFFFGIWLMFKPEKIGRPKKFSHSILIHFKDITDDITDVYYLEDNLLDDKGLLYLDGNSVAVTEEGLDEITLNYHTNHDKAALLHLKAALKSLKIPQKSYRFEVIKKKL